MTHAKGKIDNRKLHFQIFNIRHSTTMKLHTTRKDCVLTECFLASNTGTYHTEGWALSCFTAQLAMKTAPDLQRINFHQPQPN